MRYLLFTDLHGKDPRHLLKTFLEYDVDEGIFLGDIDRGKTLDFLVELSEKVNLQILPGNHDYESYNRPNKVHF